MSSSPQSSARRSQKDKIGIPKLKKFVRDKPGMYLGGTGPDALLKIISTAIDRLLRENAKYTGPIKVDCSVKNRQQRVEISFHGLANKEFSAAEVDGWLRRIENIHRSRSLFYVVICASTYFRLESSDGKQSSILTITDQSTRIKKSNGRSASFTKITFEPCREIFGTLSHDHYYKLSGLLRDVSLLRKGLRISLCDQKAGQFHHYHYERGLESLLYEEDYFRWEIHPQILRFSRKEGSVRVEGCLRFIHSGVPFVRTYVNFERTQGGSDLEGLGDVLQKIFPDSTKGCRVQRLITNPDTGTSIPVPRTFIGAMHFQTPDPRYAGPTKDVMINPEARPFVARAAAGLQLQWEKLEEKRRDAYDRQRKLHAKRKTAPAFRPGLLD